MDNDRKSFLRELQKCKDAAAVDKLELTFFGRRGLINQKLSELKNLSLEERKKIAADLNRFKSFAEAALEQRREALLKNDAEETWLDVTLPGKKKPQGSLHLVTYAIEEIARIFDRLGFVRASYPEVEREYFAFDALNMPSHHPARDDFETFFIKYEEDPKYGKLVLTPHTSSGQVREMLRLKKPPIKMINIAKCYRRNWDLTHTPMFHQFEGLCVDVNINLTHLKGTIEHFVEEFFGPGRKIRFRPFHFQFTEPSFELDISCDLCGGSGLTDQKIACRVCKAGWLELGGAGMVHPHVLAAGGLDPDGVSGWAFGFGVERNFMMKRGLKLPDLRILYDGDVRFLRQF